VNAKTKAFTLIEILLATVILLSLVTALVFSFSSLSDSQRYKEARENLKTFLTFQKHKAAFNQKTIEIQFDAFGNIILDGEEEYFNLFTNDLKILETSATKIVFFSDGGVQESYIITSSLDGQITNKLIINVLGNILETSDFSAGGSPEEEPYSSDNEER
jgi:type II secretory pathway pseudopilin PulG